MREGPSLGSTGGDDGHGPERRGRVGEWLIALLVAGLIGFASSAWLVVRGAQDQRLYWASLLANAGVVLFAGLLTARRLRRNRAADQGPQDLRWDYRDSENAASAHYANLTVDQEGTILTWNAEAERLTGYDAAQSIGNAFSFLFPPMTADIGLRPQLLRTAMQMGKASTECWVVHGEGKRLWVHLVLSRLKDPAGRRRNFHLVLRDLTESEKAREALRDREASLDRILESAMDAIITVDAEQRIVLFNAAAARMFRCSREQVMGQSLERFIPERLRAVHRSHIERFGATGITSRTHGAQTPLAAVRADGTEFQIDASISQTTLHGRKLYTAILRDITGRGKTEQGQHRTLQDLREVAVALQSAREEEQTRIARELDAGLGEGLAALKRDVAWLAQQMRGRNDVVEDKLRFMESALDRIVIDKVRISAALRPLILDDLGFGAAADWLINDFKQSTGIVCEVTLDNSLSAVGEPTATALFRVLQESLTNVARHSGATRVEIRAAREGNAVLLEVRDNGRGIQDADRSKPGASGLRGLAQRASVLAGQLRVEHAEGGGTQILFRVPLSARSKTTKAKTRS